VNSNRDHLKSGILHSEDPAQFRDFNGVFSLSIGAQGEHCFRTLSVTEELPNNLVSSTPSFHTVIQKIFL